LQGHFSGFTLFGFHCRVVRLLERVLAHTVAKFNGKLKNEVDFFLQISLPYSLIVVENFEVLGVRAFVPLLAKKGFAQLRLRRDSIFNLAHAFFLRLVQQRQVVDLALLVL